MIKSLTIVLICLLLNSCKNDHQISIHRNNHSIICTNNGCEGTYSGPEFINHSDVAHQFSDKMCTEVGDKLKFLYKRGIYSKVNFDQIKMTTKGMGTGMVIYKLSIPFKKCNKNVILIPLSIMWVDGIILLL